MEYTKDELLEIAKEHKEHLTSTSHWNEYRSLHNLPHSHTFISHFGRWNTLKKMIGLPTVKVGRLQQRSDKELITLLQENKEHFSSVIEWDKFALEHNLPIYKFLIERLGSEQLAKSIGRISVNNSKELKKVMHTYFPDTPPSTREWTTLQKKNRNLPSAKMITARFGSWNQMKYELYSK